MLTKPPVSSSSSSYSGSSSFSSIVVPTPIPGFEPTAPVYGSMGSVTILGEEYDIATTSLRLYSCGIDDAKLKQIAPQIEKLTNLTSLRLWGNQITEADIEVLKAKLPNCYISS